MKYLPNLLSLFRLVLICPFLVFLYRHTYDFAFYTFVLAGATDALDGWLARYFHWTTPFGSMIDPLSDKLLVAASFLSLALLSVLPWWLVILVFLRDITISLGVVAWYIFIKKPIAFAPTLVSKINTSLQLLLVIVCLFELAFFSFPSWLMTGLFIVTTITTTVTYIDYVLTWGRKAYLINAP
jgi:cardiolipin synthase